MPKQVIIHMGGSCAARTRTGGWAAILCCGDHRKVLTGSAADTTANALELTAVIAGLSALKSVHQTVQLVTRSQYVAKGINERLPDWIERDWKKPVANRGLWQQVAALLGQHHVTVTWLPREQNAEADQLAQTARRNHGTKAPTPAKQVIHLLIAGSRDAARDALDYARRVVRRAHSLGYTILVGDSPRGVDMAVIYECRRLKANVLVVGVTNRPRNGGCAHGSYLKIERDTYRAAGAQWFDRFHERDRYLVDTAQRGIFIWNGASRGTKAAYDYMVSRRKEAHLVTFEVGRAR